MHDLCIPYFICLAFSSSKVVFSPPFIMLAGTLSANSFKIPLVAISVSASLLVSSDPASAFSLTFAEGSTTEVVGIQDLDVEGTLYDVDFVVDIYSSVFSEEALFDSKSTALGAAEAVNSALGGETLVKSNGGLTTNGFLTPYEGEEGSGTLFTGFGIVGVEIPNPGFGTWADFSLSTSTPAAQDVPEPAMIASLFGLGAAALCKRKLSQTATA